MSDVFSSPLERAQKLGTDPSSLETLPLCARRRLRRDCVGDRLNSLAGFSFIRVS